MRRCRPDALFPCLEVMAERTGFSVYSLRKGCRENRIPHIRVGRDFRIDSEAFLKQLREEATRNRKGA